MKQTKRQKIIETAILLFNENGYGAVTLQEVAKKLEMTRGNLTYHFKVKEDLLKSITIEMWEELEKEQIKSRDFPSFQNLHLYAQSFYKLQKKYAFIFLDYHVLNHPLLKEKFKDITKQSIEDYKMALAFAISNGNLKPEPFDGAYDNIAFLTWQINFFWLTQQIILDKKTEADGQALIWSIIYPHFTEKGKKSFLIFFGEEMLKKIGKPFSTSIEDFISF